ncbi:MAG: DUF5615 family PIN-like protein [Acidobacteria bacterium]|nr:DUF5615 family PIN-like protein [Acidobacteriota bacterium]
MRLLFDENLPPRLVTELEDLFPNSLHVSECDLGSAVDRSIWEFAKAENLVIFSKDSDFHERSVLLGGPPKVIWLRVGNCSTQFIVAMLQSASDSILAFGAQQEETCLIHAAAD